MSRVTLASARLSCSTCCYCCFRFRAVLEFLAVLEFYCQYYIFYGQLLVYAMPCWCRCICFLHSLTSGLPEATVSSKSPTVVLQGMLTFSNRVINIWNSLPSHIVQAPSVATFRKRLRFQHFQVQCPLALLCLFTTVILSRTSNKIDWLIDWLIVVPLTLYCILCNYLFLLTEQKK